MDTEVYRVSLQAVYVCQTRDVVSIQMASMQQLSSDVILLSGGCIIIVTIISDVIVMVLYCDVIFLLA